MLRSPQRQIFLLSENENSASPKRDEETAGRGAGVGGCWLAPQMSLGERMADFDSQFVGWSSYKEALRRIFFFFSVLE